MSEVKISLSNIKEVMDGLKVKEASLMKAVNATTNDFRSRGPGWISQEVCSVYNVKKKDVTSAKKGTQQNGEITIAGVSLKNIEILYSGSPMTPTHFGMTPKKRPTGKSYRISAQIIKGSTVKLPPDVFLADNGGGTQIPFQREGTDRYPIKAIKTVSVPQMLGNDTVAEELTKRIGTELGKRLEHHIERYNK